METKSLMRRRHLSQRPCPGQAIYSLEGYAFLATFPTISFLLVPPEQELRLQSSILGIFVSSLLRLLFSNCTRNLEHTTLCMMPQIALQADFSKSADNQNHYNLFDIQKLSG